MKKLFGQKSCTQKASRTIKTLSRRAFLLLTLGALVGLSSKSAIAQNESESVAHVIQISIDALGGKYLEKFLEESPEDFPNFQRMVTEGATTMNARTDYFRTTTIQNHTSMITGRPVLTPEDWQDAKGHYMTFNFTAGEKKRGLEAPESLHAINPEGGYTYSSFDIAHNAGLVTALYSGKSKFSFYSLSYGEKFGEENEHGRNKVDHAHTGGGVHKKAMEGLKEYKPNYTFLHYGEPDHAGHRYGYLGDEYRDSVKKVDGYLGDIFKIVDNEEGWKGNTVITLTADHGGKPGTKGHSDAKHVYDYTIPFLAWGKGVARGADLYEINKGHRAEPGESRPLYAPNNEQPIRNGDAGNLSLKLLGLPAIPGSSINNKQDLQVR